MPQSKTPLSHPTEDKTDNLMSADKEAYASTMYDTYMSFGKSVYSLKSKRFYACIFYNQTTFWNKLLRTDLEVIKLESSLRLKIKRNDGLLADASSQSVPFILSLRTNSSFITSRPDIKRHGMYQTFLEGEQHVKLPMYFLAFIRLSPFKNYIKNLLPRKSRSLNYNFRTNCVFPASLNTIKIMNNFPLQDIFCVLSVFWHYFLSENILTFKAQTTTAAHKLLIQLF